MRFYRGAGGEGKTRLARELVVLQSSKGWYSGFLNVENVSAANADWDSLFANTQPVLIIVDYAESKRDELKRLFKELYEGIEGSELQIRIVLLARTDFLWWQEVRVASGLDNLPEQATELLPIDESLEQSFRRACSAFVKLLSKEDTTNYITNEQLKLSEGNALFLHMLAVLSVNGRVLGGDSNLKILDGILELEKEYWTKVPIVGLNEPNFDRQRSAIAQLMTIATLGYNLSHLDKSRLLVAKLPELKQEKVAVQDAVIKRCEQLYGESKGQINPLRPDILGEHLVERTLLYRYDDFQLVESILSLVYDNKDSNRYKAIQVLVRLSQRRGDAGVKLLRKSLDSRMDTLAFFAFFAMPMKSIALRELAAELPNHLLTQLEETDIPDEFKSMLLSNLAFRLGDLDQNAKALSVVKDAVKVDRKLVEKHPDSDVFLSSLAVSLNNLGIKLSYSNESEKALEAIKEATEIFKELAKEQPDEYLSDFVTSLSNLGGRLLDVGQSEEALETIQEAIKIYQNFTDEQQFTFLPQFAMLLSNLGINYNDLGYEEEALKATQKATKIYKELVDGQPDAFLPELAKSLYGLGSLFRDLDHIEEALPAIQEATDIYRELRHKNSNLFLPKLAMSLSDLGISFSDLGLGEDALRVAQEATEIYQTLIQQRPDESYEFSWRLALSLYNLAKEYFEIEKNDKAEMAIVEGISLLSPLFMDDPARIEQLILRMLLLYFDVCEKLEKESNSELVVPIIEKLQELEQ